MPLPKPTIIDAENLFWTIAGNYPQMHDLITLPDPLPLIPDDRFMALWRNLEALADLLNGKSPFNPCH
jgi:hypothetical protein